MKICIRCNIKKEFIDFVKNKNSKDGYHRYCKECTRKQGLDNYYKNPEKYIEYSKNYIKINKKKRSKITKKYDREYWLKNKDKKYAYKKLKRNIDFNFKLKDLIRCRLNNALKNTFKKGKTLDLLGCSIDEYKQYLEQQFKPEMNWENHGKVWEIDHIIPLINFDLSKLEEQQKAFCYTNTRPLFKTTEIAESLGYLNEIGNRDREKLNHG